jgi:hypothetical protein
MVTRNRPSTRVERGFIWIPITDPTIYSVKINSVDVTIDIIRAEFWKYILPDVGYFSIELINSNEEYTEVFSQNQDVELFIDYVDGTTRRFYGKVDTLNNDYKSDIGWILTIEGGHISKRVYDVLITKQYAGDKTIQTILTELIADYIPEFTLSFTSTTTIQPTLTWDNKPLGDCLVELIKATNSTTDCYINDSSVLKFFDKNTEENNSEAIVWTDNLINTDGLGPQTFSTKNKVTVLGDDGSGLPVIYTAQNTASQTLIQNREVAIFNSKINTAAQAQELGEGELSAQSSTDIEGDTESTILPSLNPGEKIWINNKPMKIMDQYRVYAVGHKFPDERTFCNINKERTNKQLFKKRIENEMNSQTVTNPYQMLGSINMVFNDYLELSTYDSNVIVQGGKITLDSGTQGTFTSVTTALSSNITQIQLRAVGSDLLSNNYYVSVDGGNNYQEITLEILTNLTTTGKNIIIRVILQSTSTEIDSLALYWK